jgi:hypothetical protein
MNMYIFQVGSSFQVFRLKHVYISDFLQIRGKFPAHPMDKTVLY